MKFLKIFYFILLLLSGYAGSAVSFVEEFDFSDDNLITAQVSQDIQEQLQSTLTTPPAIDTNSFTGKYSQLNFVLRSQYKANEAEIYISWSRSIDPSLGVQEIIFPFHSFL